MLKPGDGSVAPSAVAEMSPEELEEAEARLNDRERLIGLVAAPLAALCGLLVINSDIDNDPRQFLITGAANPAYTSISLYHELLVVLLGLGVLMIVTSFLRKRLFLGIVLAMYGLAIFNLHYWGFGVPFILGGAWFLVRAYRLQQAVKAATSRGDISRPRPDGGAAAPRRSKRYTPPRPQRKRPPAS
jgi:hypothetical protein